MRIAVLIIGLMLTVGLFFQSLTVNVLSNVVDDEGTTEASSVGDFMALMWLVACGLVIPKPRISMVIFALAALFGASGWSEFPDLEFWSGVSVVLAVLSYLGYRGKRSKDAKEAERDELMRQMAGHQSAIAGTALSLQGAMQGVQYQAVASRPTALPSRYCPTCGESNAASGRFCGTCGASLTE